MNKFAKITLWIFPLVMVFFAVLGLFKIVGKGTSIYVAADSEMYGYVDKTGREVVGAKYLDAQ